MEKERKEERRHHKKDHHHGEKHHHGEGRHHGEGHHEGGHGRGGYRILAQPEGTQLLFIGSRSCTRHRGTEKLELQREGKLSFLCLEEIDWVSGDYLDMVEQAAEEIIEERKPLHLMLFGGCQVEILSMDYDALAAKLSEKYGIDVYFHKGCHLIGYDKHAER